MHPLKNRYRASGASFSILLGFIGTPCEPVAANSFFAMFSDAPALGALAGTGLGERT
jgi:hypothetical protein